MNPQRSFIGEPRQRVPVRRAPGASRSEIKEEAKPGDIRGGKYPVACARTPDSSAERKP
ncbi:hypothetical protein D9M68_508000 [compost metagenome]